MTSDEEWLEPVDVVVRRVPRWQRVLRAPLTVSYYRRAGCSWFIALRFTALTIIW